MATFKSRRYVSTTFVVELAAFIGHEAYRHAQGLDGDVQGLHHLATMSALQGHDAQLLGEVVDGHEAAPDLAVVREARRVDVDLLACGGRQERAEPSLLVEALLDALGPQEVRDLLPGDPRVDAPGILEGSIYAAEAARIVVDLVRVCSRSVSSQSSSCSRVTLRSTSRTAASSLPRSGDDVSGLK